MAKNKHLTDLDRLQIQHGLLHRNSIKKIAFDLGKAQLQFQENFVSVQYQTNVTHTKILIGASHRFDCSKHYLCEDKPNCIKQCRSCNYAINYALILLRIFVKLSFHLMCDGCPDEYICVLRKNIIFIIQLIKTTAKYWLRQGKV